MSVLKLKHPNDVFVSYKHSFSCELLVDYCDVFVSCLASHSDGTHSLQISHWWASDVCMLKSSKSDLMNKLLTRFHFCLKVSTFPANIHFFVSYCLRQYTNMLYLIIINCDWQLTMTFLLSVLTMVTLRPCTLMFTCWMEDMCDSPLFSFCTSSKLGKQPRVIAYLWQDVGTRTFKLEADPIKSSVVWVRGHMAGAKSIVGPRDVRTDELLISARAASAFISPKCASSLTLWPCGYILTLYYFPKANTSGEYSLKMFALVSDVLGQNNNIIYHSPHCPFRIPILSKAVCHRLADLLIAQKNLAENTITVAGSDSDSSVPANLHHSRQTILNNYNYYFTDAFLSNNLQKFTLCFKMPDSLTYKAYV